MSSLDHLYKILPHPFRVEISSRPDDDQIGIVLAVRPALCAIGGEVWRIKLEKSGKVIQYAAANCRTLTIAAAGN